NLAGYLIALDSISEAREAARAALLELRLLGMTAHVSMAVECFAAIAARSGFHEQAARLFGFGEASYAARGNDRETTEQATYDAGMALLAAVLPDDIRRRLMAEGAAWTEEQAADESLRI